VVEVQRVHHEQDAHRCNDGTRDLHIDDRSDQKRTSYKAQQCN
jgi:hypothetical protein